MSNHAPLAPSAAHRWIPCPASVNAEKGFPEPPMKRETALGCAMHEVRARYLNAACSGLEEFIGWTFFGGTRIPTAMTAELLDFLRPGLKRFEELAAPAARSNNPEHYRIEQTLHFDDHALREVYGTLDAGALVAETIILSDLKFGIGVPVYPKHNEQQLIYGGLFYDQLERKDKKAVTVLHIIIDQPRSFGGGGEWLIAKRELECWIGEVLHPAIEAVHSRNPKYGPGPKACYFCKAKPTCEAHREHNIETLGITFADARDAENISAVSLSKISPERRSYILQRKKMIEDFLEALGQEALADALAGRPCPGFFAGYGNKGKREWFDEQAASDELERLLGPKAFVTRCLSPAEAEKALPAADLKKLKPYWDQAPPAPKLYPKESNKTAIPLIQMEDVRGKTNDD